MKSPRKKKRPKTDRPMESVPLRKLIQDVKEDIRMRFGDSDKPKRD